MNAWELKINKKKRLYIWISEIKTAVQEKKTGLATMA
jgi:hypothetical protein